MCFVSAVFVYGRDQIPRDDWNRQSFEDFKGMVKQAEKFDRDHDQPDCEDPAKAAWMREVEERLRKLESA